MNLIEQFKAHAYDDSKDLLAFFHGLKKKEQQALKSTIAEVFTDMSTDKSYRGVVDSTGMTPLVQLRLCAMHVYTVNTYWQQFGSVPKAYWKQRYYRVFRPKWISRLLDVAWLRVDISMFFEILRFSDVDIPDQMIAEKIATSLITTSWESDTYTLNTQVFDNFPELLSTYIWLLFSEENTAYQIDSLPSKAWTKTLIDLADTGRVDRARLLSECVQTAGRNFKQQQTGWYFKLFTALNPTLAELSALQSALVLALHSPYSKVQNESLKHLKTLANAGKLDEDAFIDSSIAPLTSSTKSVVMATIGVIEKLAQDRKANHDVLCEILPNALIFRDEKVQTRVAKFLLKYGNTNAEALTSALSEYVPDTFSEVQTMLAPFSSVETPTSPSEAVEPIETTPKIREDNHITLPTDFDDQCFYLTQAFQSHTPWQFDGYLCVVRKVLANVDDTNLARIESIWEQANIIAPNGNGRYAEILMQKHFITCARALFPRLHDKSAPLLTEDLSFLHEKSLHLFQARLDHCQRLLQNKQDVPMLSTPTHSPCFIALTTFVERLNAYAEQLDWIDVTDFQIALSRLVIDEHASADGLSGELAELMRYIMTGERHDAHCKTPALWLSALHYRGDIQGLSDYGQQCDIAVDDWLPTLAWREKDAVFTLDWWHRQKDRDFDDDLDEPEVSQHTQPTTHVQPFQQYFLDDVLGTGNCGFIPTFEDSDFKKLLYATPHDPTALCVMAVLTQSGLSNTINIMESSALSALNAFLHSWDKDFSEVVYLFYTCQMLPAKKPVAQLSSELWLQKVSENQMDSEQLGRVLGKLEHDEFAPLKRFTDLITAQLMNVSTQHNQALITLISAMIAEMHDTPIKGVKKLLELYLELLTVSKTPLPSVVETKLATWAEVKSLKAIVRKLMA